MDAFLNGLDGRLRVSGMVADSIMMGIVNSAMEVAYENSCTKEGDLERLNEKSRFCELAIMQLEWCLKYLQEETESNIFDETHDREGFLYELLETRDRIHHRLEETELSIAEKDKELLEMKEIEADLRLALELRDEDILSLHTALGLEREKSERANKSFPCKSRVVEKKGVHVINELKDRVDQQIQKIEGKLEEGKINLIEMMNAQHSGLLTLENLESRYDLDVQERSKPAESNDVQVVRKTSDGARSFNQEWMAQLVVDLGEMVFDINMLKEKLDSSFRMMANSISSFKTVLNEQQWIWNFEKETINLITRDFLKDMQDKISNGLGASKEDLMPLFCNFNWSTLIDDIRKLHDVLDTFSTWTKMQSKVELRVHHCLPISLDVDCLDNLDCRSSLQSDSFIRKYAFSEVLCADEDDCNVISRVGFGRIDGADALVEDDSCKLSAKPTKSCSENELSRRNLSVDLGLKKTIRNNEHNVQKKADINGILRELAEGKRYLASRYDDTIRFVQETFARVIPKLELLIKENWKFSAVSDDHEKFYGQDQKFIKDIVPELHLNEETIKSMISDEIYLILLEGLIQRIHNESIDCDIETQIRKEINTVILSRLFEEWKCCNETYKMERLIIEELYSLVLARIFKDNILSLSCTSKILPREGTTCDGKFFHSCQSNGDMFSQIYQEPRESLASLEFTSHDLEASYNQRGQSLNWHGMVNPVNEILDKPTQQISLSEPQFGESCSNLGSACATAALTCDQENVPMRAGNYDQCFSQKFEDQHFCQLQFVLVSFAKVSQLLEAFELVVHDKMHLNMERLENLAYELKPLVEQVNSVNKKELLYQKAFIRRCCDLQIAEEEVDLLGDQVDVLVSLVENIYSTLLHYSPLSQNISEIVDVLRLIEQELWGEPTFISIE